MGMVRGLFSLPYNDFKSVASCSTVYWAARSTFSYRNQQPSEAVWSPDASLIAVAHGPSVTIWEPISNTLVSNLACAEADTVSGLCFLGASGRYLATYSGKDVITWDLLANTSMSYFGLSRW